MSARIEALKAETPEFLRPYVSRESYIDRAIQELINKGWENLTDDERQEYLDLVQERVDRMIPAAVHQFRQSNRDRQSRSTNTQKRWWQKSWQAMAAFFRASKTRLIAWWRSASDV